MFITFSYSQKFSTGAYVYFYVLTLKLILPDESSGEYEFVVITITAIVAVCIIPNLSK